MKKTIINLVLLVLMMGSVQAAKYFVLDVNNLDGSVTFNSNSLKEIDRVIENNGKIGLLIKTVSYLGKILDTVHYEMSENKNYVIYIPYNKEATKIEMYNLKNSMIMEIGVSSFADTCGNNICEDYETYDSCSKDCIANNKDSIPKENSDKISNPTPTNHEIDQPKPIVENSNSAASELNNQGANQNLTTNYYLWGLLFLFIFVFILIFVFIKKRNEDKTINSLREYAIENQRKGFTMQQIRDALSNNGYRDKEIEKALKSLQ